MARASPPILTRVKLLEKLRFGELTLYRVAVLFRRYRPVNCNSNNSSVQIADIPTPQPRPKVTACVCQRVKLLDLSITGVNDAELVAIAVINTVIAVCRFVPSPLI